MTHLRTHSPLGAELNLGEKVICPLFCIFSPPLTLSSLAANICFHPGPFCSACGGNPTTAGLTIQSILRDVTSSPSSETLLSRSAWCHTSLYGMAGDGTGAFRLNLELFLMGPEKRKGYT